MTTIENSVIAAINCHIVEHGVLYASWYVGIAQSPRVRLFEDHNVNSETDLWIYRDAETSDTARRIEKYFINQLDTDGGPGVVKIPHMCMLTRRICILTLRMTESIVLYEL